MSPYTLTDYNWRLHYFVDANVATPHEESSGAIADGTPSTEATVVECKSFTGSVAMLGGGAIEAICQRQHLKNPDSHIAEVTAGGTCLNQAYTHRGIMGELRLPQVEPAPCSMTTRGLRLRASAHRGRRTYFKFIQWRCYQHSRFYIARNHHH